MFDNFETKTFPAHLCTKKNPREKDVRDSDARFTCVLVDRRFPDQCRVLVLSPYTCRDIEDRKKTLLGWVDKSGNYYDHRDHSIHEDNERVVAWRETSETPNFMEAFEASWS